MSEQKMRDILRRILVWDDGNLPGDLLDEAREALARQPAAERKPAMIVFGNADRKQQHWEQQFIEQAAAGVELTDREMPILPPVEVGGFGNGPFRYTDRQMLAYGRAAIAAHEAKKNGGGG